jgi:protein-disulfide isomerase
MRGIVALIAIACASLIGLAVYLTIRPADEGPRILELSPAAVVRKEKNAWIQGPENAPVTLVEFSDYQCPACAALHPIVKDTLKRTGDYVQFQQRHYIIPGHNKARIAARAAEAAGRQGKFFDMTDIMFTGQNTWIDQLPSDFRTTVIGYARALTLNLDQFQADLDASDVDRMIDTDVRDANNYGITGTPMFVVNGKMLTRVPRSVDEFVAVLEEARANAPQPSASPSAAASAAASASATPASSAGF